jgi:hypothetical protein
MEISGVPILFGVDTKEALVQKALCKLDLTVLSKKILDHSRGTSRSRKILAFRSVLVRFVGLYLLNG